MVLLALLVGMVVRIAAGVSLPGLVLAASPLRAMGPSHPVAAESVLAQELHRSVGQAIGDSLSWVGWAFAESKLKAIMS